MKHDNDIVYLMRGDSFEKKIEINLGTKLNPEYYTLQPGDKVLFGLMEPNRSFEDAVVKRKYTYNDSQMNDGNIVIKLRPKDTIRLQPGKYFYMIKFIKRNTDGSNSVKTILNPTQFFIEGNLPEEINCLGKCVDTIVLDGGDII